MKSLLAVLVFVGVAFCNSTNYYGWTPNKELVYRYESQVLTSIPEIRESQRAGLRLSAEVRVQAFSDYSLRIKFEKSRFLTVNGEVNLSERGRLVKGGETEQGIQEAEIPSHLRAHLEKPFLVHLKRGIVENFFVEASEPQSITNIKRSFLAQIQLDITGSRKDEIESNHVQQQQQQQQNRLQDEAPESNKDITYFTTREESLLGDCQTSYAIHELPKYRALELEQEWKEQEKKLYQQVEVESKGDEVCHGKKYFRINKTKNLDNCRKSPYFQKIVGLRNKCDGSKAACADLFTHMVSTSCVVCGELNEFVIRKCLKKDIVLTNPMGWNTEENMKRSTTVTVELLREESSFSPIPTPSDLKEKKSLIFEYPESNHQVSQGRLNKQTDQSGIQPILSQPDLLSSPKMLFTVGLSKDEISRQVVEELKRIAAEVFESPESCSSTGDAAGHLAAISKYLLPLSLDELKAVKEEIMQAGRHSEASQKVLKGLFYDVLSVVGTNPSVMLIKKDIESGELTGRSAINVLEAAFRAIRTPTKELLKELVQMVKNLKNLEWREHKTIGTTLKDIETVGMVQVSKLLYRACINPVRRMTEFPVRIYGHFCSNESSIITEEWIPYLKSELESSSSRNQQDDHFRLVAITSLGKLGHIRALQSLVKVIDGSISTRPMIRSIAVYSLKRIAKQNPVLIKPILLAIIDNPAENTQVRIAAVSVLPWAQPSTAQLQKMASRTWFEPSKQVASFIHSTLRNLKETEVPELKAVGLKVQGVLHMAKPFQYGIQYSHNVNFAQYVEYLKSAVSKKFSWVYNEEEVVPTRMHLCSKVYNPSFVAQGLSFTVYTQGMDYLLDRALYTTSKKSPISESVKEQLEKIAEELKIQKREEKSGEVFVQSRIAGYERLFTINKEYVMEALERASELLLKNPQVLSEGHHFEYSRALQVIDIQRLNPTSAGFLSYGEEIVPIVYSVKGSYKGEEPTEGAVPVPTKVSAKLMPVINAKIHSHVGVICPFTEQLIGAGVDAAVHISTPLEAEIEVDSMRQVSVSMKTPESIKKSIELAHIYVTPYTARKNLKTVKPIGKSSDLKTVLSRSPMKKVEVDLSKRMGLSVKLSAETDAKYADFYSYWQKFQMRQCPIAISTFAALPSSIRRSSLKIVYNPAESETKEISLHFSLAKGKRNEQNQEEEISHSDEKMIQNICKSNNRGQNVERCQEQLNDLEVISREAEELCQRISHDDESERKKCQRTAQICEKALQGSKP